MPKDINSENLLETIIISHIRKYPLLYKDINYEYSRQKVLHQMFFVNGNGLEWENGILIGDEFNKSAYNEFPENYFETPLLSTEKDESDFIKKFRTKQGKDYNPHEICSKKALTFYPLCKYAKILNIPDDIDPAWLNAANEILQVAFNYWSDPYKQLNDIYIKEYVNKREYDKIREYVNEQLELLTIAHSRILELRTDLL